MMFKSVLIGVSATLLSTHLCLETASAEIEKIPANAVEIEPRNRLENGDNVSKKIRRILVNGKLTMSSDGNHLDVPTGTMVWKDFYLETSRGRILIERRIIRKEATNELNSQDNFFGWSFGTAHHLPRRFQKDHGPVFVDLSLFPISRFDLSSRANGSMEEQNRLPETILHQRNGTQDYIFPGKKLCHSCHAGAPGIREVNLKGGSAGHRESTPPNLLFLLQPGNMTTASIDRLKQKGWLGPNVEKFLIGADDSQIDDLTKDFMGVLRNNCLTCHNNSPLSAGRFTDFKLNPRKKYHYSQLAAYLAENEAFDGKPFVTFKNRGEIVEPKDTAISRRVFKHNSAQMPPEIGGLPAVPEHFKQKIMLWLQGAASLQHMVQAILRSKGIKGKNGKPLVIDGSFGRPRRSNSYFALKTFQAQVGIPQVGDYRDERTLSALKIMP